MGMTSSINNGEFRHFEYPIPVFLYWIWFCKKLIPVEEFIVILVHRLVWVKEIPWRVLNETTGSLPIEEITLHCLINNSSGVGALCQPGTISVFFAEPQQFFNKTRLDLNVRRERWYLSSSGGRHRFRFALRYRQKWGCLTLAGSWRHKSQIFSEILTLIYFEAILVLVFNYLRNTSLDSTWKLRWEC